MIRSGLGNALSSVTSKVSNTFTALKPSTASFSLPTGMFKPATAVPTTAVAGAAIGTGAVAAGIVAKTDDVAVLGTKADELGQGAKAVGSDTPHLDNLATQGDEAAQKAAKEAEELRNAEKATPENIKKVEDDAKADANIKETKESVLTKKNATMAAGIAGVSIYAGIAADNFFKKNGKKYNIISIEDASTDSINKTKITIQSGDRFSEYDKVIIQDTNCVPIIDPSNNEFNIEKIITRDEFIIITPSKITTKGTKGTVTLDTKYSNQLADLVKNGLEDAGSSVGGGLGGFTTNFFEGMGISSDKIWIVLTVIGGLILLGILFAVYRMIFPNNK